GLGQREDAAQGGETDAEHRDATPKLRKVRLERLRGGFRAALHRYERFLDARDHAGGQVLRRQDESETQLVQRHAPLSPAPPSVLDGARLALPLLLEPLEQPVNAVDVELKDLGQRQPEPAAAVLPVRELKRALPEVVGRKL